MSILANFNNNKKREILFDEFKYRSCYEFIIDFSTQCETNAANGKSYFTYDSVCVGDYKDNELINNEEVIINFSALCFGIALGNANTNAIDDVYGKYKFKFMRKNKKSLIILKISKVNN